MTYKLLNRRIMVKLFYFKMCGSIATLFAWKNVYQIHDRGPVCTDPAWVDGINIRLPQENKMQCLACIWD